MDQLLLNQLQLQLNSGLPSPQVKFIKIANHRVIALPDSIQSRTKPCFLKASPKSPNTSPNPFYISPFCNKFSLTPSASRNVSQFLLLAMSNIHNLFKQQCILKSLVQREGIDRNGVPLRFSLCTLFFGSGLNSVTVSIFEILCFSLFDMLPHPWLKGNFMLN